MPGKWAVFRDLSKFDTTNILKNRANLSGL